MRGIAARLRSRGAAEAQPRPVLVVEGASRLIGTVLLTMEWIPVSADGVQDICTVVMRMYRCSAQCHVYILAQVQPT